MKLFVYGTLKRGEPRAAHLREATYLGTVQTAPHFRLYHPLRADYPCLVRVARNGVIVEGELYEVCQETLERLDRVEGVPDLFVRQLVALASGEQVLAYLMRAKPWFARDLGSRWR
jgi:gamma-glutamylcyclotransferase (GGCT)/AIG2-like uncharacterized protein YtfP